MILEINNGEIRKPRSNLNVVFKDDKKAMEDMSRLGEVVKVITQINQKYLKEGGTAFLSRLKSWVSSLKFI